MNPKALKGILAISLLLVLGYIAGTISARSPGKGPVVVSYGEVDIGGAFTLMDTDGMTVTDQDLLGKKALVYFGYTNCPDVCPLDMNRISMALERLEEEGVSLDTLQPVFITVDPARDTPEQIALFLNQYHASFIGLTGTFEQMEQAAKAYKVAYEKILEGDMMDMVSHSSYMYLMDETGKYLAHYGSDVPPDALAEALADHIG